MGRKDRSSCTEERKSKKQVKKKMERREIHIRVMNSGRMKGNEEMEVN